MPILKLISSNTNFKFMRFKRAAMIASILFFLVSCLSIFIQGLNFGIDFTGGSLIEVRSTSEKINLNHLRKDLNKLNIGEIQLQTIGSDRDIAIRIQKREDGEENQSAVINQIKKSLSDLEIEFRRVEYLSLIHI